MVRDWFFHWMWHGQYLTMTLEVYVGGVDNSILCQGHLIVSFFCFFLTEVMTIFQRVKITFESILSKLSLCIITRIREMIFSVPDTGKSQCAHHRAILKDLNVSVIVLILRYRWQMPILKARYWYKEEFSTQQTNSYHWYDIILISQWFNMLKMHAGMSLYEHLPRVFFF